MRDRSTLSRAPRGFSLLETLVAVTVASAFLAGMTAAFIQVLQSANQAQTVMNSVANGRVALDSMSVDLKQAVYYAGNFEFIGIDAQALAGGFSYGDGVDNDNDGETDEDSINGEDDDADWTLASDNHGFIAAGVQERPNFIGAADLGDFHVDEDPKFEADSIVFRFPPSAASSLESRISFFVGEFENRSHTLIKRTEYLDAANTVVSTEEAPLADGVLSFAALYWQPNGTSMYWVTEWDSAAALVDAEPYLPLPAAIWLGLAVYADDRPIETYVPGMPVRVEHLSTVVTIESTINDPRYRRW